MRRRSDRPDTSPEGQDDEGQMQIVYAMEVIDPVASQDGTRYVRRFTYETREEAWAKYTEAIRFGFEATVEQVGRMRSTKQTASA
jgi:hypothetical protein